MDVNTSRSLCDGLPEEGNRLRKLRIAKEKEMHTFWLDNYPEHIENIKRIQQSSYNLNSITAKASSQLKMAYIHVLMHSINGLIY